MRGLRKREDDSFERFFKIVQEEAKKQQAVFFLDCGEGRDFEVGDLAGEDMSGWLIPLDKASEFERDWADNGDMDTWDDFFRFASWTEADPVSIEFIKV